jgi:hypothetical protein
MRCSNDDPYPGTDLHRSSPELFVGDPVGAAACLKALERIGFAIMLLRYVPPMGIYETLYAFWGTFGTSMGEPGTHPWSQGFPRTVQLPNGPAMPTSVPVVPQDLLYPKAWGLPALREAIATYDQTFYGATLAADNVRIFAGGRPALIATMASRHRSKMTSVPRTVSAPASC